MCKHIYDLIGILLFKNKKEEIFSSPTFHCKLCNDCVRLSIVTNDPMVIGQSSKDRLLSPFFNGAINSLFPGEKFPWE